MTVVFPTKITGWAEAIPVNREAFYGHVEPFSRSLRRCRQGTVRAVLDNEAEACRYRAHCDEIAVHSPLPHGYRLGDG